MSIQTSCCATTVIEASRSKERARGRCASQAVCQKNTGRTKGGGRRTEEYLREAPGEVGVTEVQQLDATTPVVATLLPRPLLRVQQELVFHLEEEPTKLVDSDEVPGLHRRSRGERVLDDPTDRARVV